MNELIILSYFFVAMIPLTAIAWLIENKLKNFDKWKTLETRRYAW